MEKTSTFCQFCLLFEYMFILSRKACFLTRTSPNTFSGCILHKTKRQQNFWLKPWTNTSGKMPILWVFETDVFVVLKGLFAMEKVENRLFTIYFHDLWHGSTGVTRVTGGYKRPQGLLDFTRGDKGLQGVTRGYRVLQWVARGYRGLQGVTGGYMGLEGVTGGEMGWPGVTGVYKGLQGFTRGDRGWQWGYRGLQGVTRGYRMLQGVTSGDRGWQGVIGGYKGL